MKNIQKVISSFKHFIDYMKAFSKETQKVWGKKKKKVVAFEKNLEKSWQKSTFCQICFYSFLLPTKKRLKMKLQIKRIKTRTKNKK